MLSKYTLLCVICLLLSSCYKEVLVPVYSCPESIIPLKEVLKTSTLTPEADTDTILKAFIYDIKYLNSYSDQLLTILNGYKREGVSVQSNGEMQK